MAYHISHFMIAFLRTIVYNDTGIRMWLSLVERLLWEQDAAGSNPVIRTKTTVFKKKTVVFLCIFSCCG